MLTGKSETVSFRLDAEMIQQLTRAANVIGVSRGEYAKHLVTQGLTNSFAESTKNVLMEVRHDLRLLREEHVTSTNALLIAAGKLSPEKALTFIQTKLLKQPAATE